MSREFWATLPGILALSIGCTFISWALVEWRSIWAACQSVNRSLFGPPDNVIDMADYRALDRLTVRQSESLEFKNFRTMQRAERWPADVSERVH